MDSNLCRRAVIIDRASVADLLTLTRVVIAPVIAWLLATRHLDAAVIALGFAWLTDLLDGRFARTAPRSTRLRDWDFRADAWLASWLVVGLGGGGYISWWIVAPTAIPAFAGLLLLGNPAPVMVGHLVLSVIFLWTVTRAGGRLWWLPGAYVLILLVLGWKRFFRVVLPALWSGLTALHPKAWGRRRSMALDDWVD